MTSPSSLNTKPRRLALTIDPTYSVFPLSLALPSQLSPPMMLSISRIPDHASPCRVEARPFLLPSRNRLCHQNQTPSSRCLDPPSSTLYFARRSFCEVVLRSSKSSQEEKEETLIVLYMKSPRLSFALSSFVTNHQTYTSSIQPPKNLPRTQLRRTRHSHSPIYIQTYKYTNAYLVLGHLRYWKWSRMKGARIGFSSCFLSRSPISDSAILCQYLSMQRTWTVLWPNHPFDHHYLFSIHPFFHLPHLFLFLTTHHFLFPILSDQTCFL